MNSLIEIWNFALLELGITEGVSSLTENSKKAKVLQKISKSVRHKIIRSFDWPNARRTRELTLIEEQPDDYHGYSYVYPPQAIGIKKIQSGVRNETENDRVFYKIESKADGTKIILTDMEEAIVEYWWDNTNYTHWPEDMKMAYALSLAHKCARPLGLKNSTSMRREIERDMKEIMTTAQINALHEEQNDLPPESDLLRSRE